MSGCRWQPSAFILFPRAPRRGQGQTREVLGGPRLWAQGLGNDSASFWGRYSSRLFPPFSPLLPMHPAGALTSSPQASQGLAAPTALFAMTPQPRALQGQSARGVGVHKSLKLPHVHCMCMHGSRGPCCSPPIKSLCICRACVPVCQTWGSVSAAVSLLVPLRCPWAIPLMALAPT